VQKGAWELALDLLGQMKAITNTIPPSSYSTAPDVAAAVGKVPGTTPESTNGKSIDNNINIPTSSSTPEVPPGPGPDETTTAAVATKVRVASPQALLSAYAHAAATCARAGKPEEVSGLLEEMQAGGLEPNLGFLNSVTLAHSMAGDMEAAVQSLEDARAAGLGPDTAGYNHVILGCSRAGRYELALEVFDALEGEKRTQARPDRRSYNAALEACARGGQAQRALGLLRAMQALP
ncbi:unnamed protein product, partial [Discosporangium mesarthrocarpum]